MALPRWPLHLTESTLHLLVMAFKKEVLEAIRPIEKLLFRKDVRDEGIQMNWKIFIEGLIQLTHVQKKHSLLYPDPLLCEEIFTKAFTVMQLYPVECGPLVWETWKDLCNSVGYCERDVDEDGVPLPSSAQSALRSFGDTIAQVIIPHAELLERKRLKRLAARKKALEQGSDATSDMSGSEDWDPNKEKEDTKDEKKAASEAAGAAAEEGKEEDTKDEKKSCVGSSGGSSRRSKGGGHKRGTATGAYPSRSSHVGEDCPTIGEEEEYIKGTQRRGRGARGSGL